MNTVIYKNNPIELDQIRIGEISEKLGLHKRLIELLFSRGIDSEERISRFLHPSKSDMYDPFLMKNMHATVARLKQAIDNGEKIVVYGDYDADGVCSSAILALFFTSRGTDVVVHIPNRIEDGYGLNTQSIEEIIEEHFPDLILTCDCGISGVAEVEHCKDLGVDIIVTDHHEPGDVVPDCLVVNPKQVGDQYPDKFLCGAGVALKLVQAICGDESYLEFIDMAAIATIADLVPLLDENRLIVQLGLKKLSSGNCNFGLKKLLRSQGLSGLITSQDIAFKIAPRINAAGRMGDAFRAFEMLTSNDDAKVDAIISSIESDNDERKKLCDIIYAEAEADLAFEELVHNRAIILSNPEWSKGVTGIAAARFAGDYHRPTFIIVDRTEEGVYKGTARGIKGINIYEALAYCGDLLLEYGGHTGAAGFSVKEENVPAFKARMNEYMAAQPAEYFLPSVCYDLDVDPSECNKKFLEAMSLIEPCGHGNTKPLLRAVARNVRVTPCKNPQHSAVQIGGLQTYAFNFVSRNQFLMGDGEKDIIFELTDGLNGGVSGYVKSVAAHELYINDALAPANYLAALMLNGSGEGMSRKYEQSEIESLLPTSVYGTLFVCADRVSYKKLVSSYGDRFVIHDYIYKSEKNNFSGIVVSPSFEEMPLGNYERIVFVDSPPCDAVVSYLNSKTNAEICVPKVLDSRIYAAVSTDRAVFAKYYSDIIAHQEAAHANPIVHYKRLSALVSGVKAEQFVVCLAVFFELGFIAIKGGKMTVDREVHSPLTNSKIYAALCEQGIK